ncbi:phosphoadenosine phosphosulfate reductase family protein [Paraburkholderia sp. EG304]|uniref:phosphoadenosine phosphosulfate reductase domain-containing protein n=1 Tax=Paraburkholderia sp. EG304 TaxID=3237015 RepID=UPI00397A3549
MRKQSLSHEDFLKLRAAAQSIPQDALELKIDQAIDVIRDACRGHQAAFAWSGGKDSQALRFVAERAGVVDCVLGICDLEFPAFLRWVTDHMPEHLHVINTGLDLDWLAAHESMLFPQDAQTASGWFHRIQHRAQQDFCRERDVDALLLGRRREDGNFTGRAGGITYEKRGVTYIAPLAGWSHEDVFAVIDRYSLPLPPFYGWPRGFRTGTHCWPARQWCESEAHGWREVHAIDPDIAPWAAQRLTSARRFMASL